MVWTSLLLSRLSSTERFFPLHPEYHLMSLLDISNPMGKGKLPVPPTATGKLDIESGGSLRDLLFLLRCLALLWCVLMNMRSSPGGPITQMLTQAFPKKAPLHHLPFCHVHNSESSLGAASLLFPSMSVCLTFPETIDFFRPKFLPT